jgi:hypothetical protein
MNPVTRKLRALLVLGTLGGVIAAGAVLAQSSTRIQLQATVGNYAPPEPDFLPNGFSFPSLTNVDPDGLPVQSGQVTITGINQTVNVTVSDDGTGSDPRVRVGSGPWLTSTTLRNNDRLTISILPVEDVFSTTYRALVSVGEASGSFTVTTRDADLVPDAFSFISQSSIPPGTIVSSNPVTLSGFDLPVEVSLVGTEGSPQYRVAGGSWTNAGVAGTASPGNVVEIRMESGPEDAVRSATLTAGGVSATFTVETIPAPDACEIGPAGTVCEDGAIYVGNMASGARMYAAPADEATLLAQTAVTPVNFNNLSTNLSDGILNTNAMMRDPAGHPAAAACRARGEDWFLPARDDTTVLRSAAANGHITVASTTPTEYWSSTHTATLGTGTARNLVAGSASTMIARNSTATRRVLCVRIGPEPSPISLSIAPVTNVPTSFLSESAVTTISGLIRTEMLTVTGDGSPQMSVSNGPWASSALVSPGDTIRVRMTSASNFATTRTASVRMSGVERATFSVTTESGIDCTTGTVGTRCQDDGSIYVGNTVDGVRMYMSSADDGVATWKSENTLTALTLNGVVQTNITASADGLLNTNILVSSTGTHAAANVCRDKGPEWHLPSPSEMITISGNLASIPAWAIPDPTQIVWTSTNGSTGATTRRFNAAGGVVNRTTSYAVRCVRTDDSDWTTSGSFSFGSVSSQPRNTVVESQEALISGLRNPGEVAISVSGEGSPQISIAGGPWVTSGMVGTDEPVKVRLTTANALDATRTATVTVGGVNSTFSVTTFGDCTVGPVGTACESDGAIFVGVNGAGERLYMSASNDNATGTRWKTDTSATAGATSASDGKSNMAAIIAAGIANHPAAALCSNKGAGWYLPAFDELQVFFSSGVLPTGTRYWSSLEFDADTTRAVASDGTARNRTKTETTSNNVRCVRN